MAIPDDDKDRLYGSDRVKARDRVWNAVLRQANDGWFRVDTLIREQELDDLHRRTVQRVLRAMEATGWVDTSTKQSPTYGPGPVLRELSETWNKEKPYR